MPNTYQEVAVVKGPSGVVCAITQYEANGITRHSFSFYKEYEVPGGQKKRSHWFDSRHIEALRKVVTDVEIWLDQRERSRRTA